MTANSLPPFPLTIDGVEYEAQMAEVEYYNFEREDHGLFSDNIGFKGAGWGQGFGGYALDSYDKDAKERVGTAFGMDFMLECYSQLGAFGTKGQQVIVLRKADAGWGGNIVGFARVNPDGSFKDPFFPKKLAEKHGLNK